jgi:hypothetical protein
MTEFVSLETKPAFSAETMSDESNHLVQRYATIDGQVWFREDTHVCVHLISVFPRNKAYVFIHKPKG